MQQVRLSWHVQCGRKGDKRHDQVTPPTFIGGMAPGFVGLWQINAEVPASVTPGPAVSLTITAGGVTSNTVTIAVE